MVGWGIALIIAAEMLAFAANTLAARRVSRRSPPSSLDDVAHAHRRPTDSNYR